MAIDTTPTKYPREWELVSTCCSRLQVPGGWVLKIWDNDRDTAVVFISDPDYVWILKGKYP